MLISNAGLVLKKRDKKFVSKNGGIMCHEFLFAAVGVLHQQRIAHQCLKVKNTFKGEKNWKRAFIFEDIFS